MEIPPHTLVGLRQRLLDQIRQRIRNGELTERSLARMTGISQPHVHNVLKGIRVLSPELADVVLTSLRLSALDLIPHDEITEFLTRTSSHRQSRLHAVPVLRGLLGRRGVHIADYDTPAWPADTHHPRQRLRGVHDVVE